MQMVNAALTANNLFDPGLINRQAFATSFMSSAVLNGRLAHAYLFTGRAHEDSDQLATELAAFLNCTRREALQTPVSQFSQDQLSCRLYFSGKEIEKVFPQYCQNCRWILDRKHPQALVKLDSEGSKSNRISVDKARLLTGELSMESAYTRVIVIDDANQEVFHRPAANAILKTMESPRTPCVFCLFAVREEEVLPTVVSRCQVVPLKSTENHVTSFGRAEAKSLLNSMPTDSENEGLAKIHADMKELSESLKHVSRSNGALVFIDASKKLQDLISDCDPAWMIDVLVEDEINRRGRVAINDPKISKYLFSLANLAEDTNLQITQYVATKSALESFCLSWWQLKNVFQLW
jgi:DNA polymerase III delta prime subunit